MNEFDIIHSINMRIIAIKHITNHIEKLKSGKDMVDAALYTSTNDEDVISTDLPRDIIISYFEQRLIEENNRYNELKTQLINPIQDGQTASN